MATNKKISKKDLIGKAVEASGYDEKSALALALKNGNSTGVRTARNGGIKVVSLKDKSGSALARSLVILENFPNVKSISAEKVEPFFKKYASGPESIRVSNIISKILSEKEKKTVEYKNIDFLSGEARNIRRGAIIGYEFIN